MPQTGWGSALTVKDEPTPPTCGRAAAALLLSGIVVVLLYRITDAGFGPRETTRIKNRA